jgi:hypothetical protein
MSLNITVIMAELVHRKPASTWNFTVHFSPAIQFALSYRKVEVPISWFEAGLSLFENTSTHDRAYLEILAISHQTMPLSSCKECGLFK